MRVAFVQIMGIDTRYVYAGSGPAILLLHGVGLSADCFMKNVDELAKQHTVFAVDMLGHGFTEAADFNGEAAQVSMARHVVGFLEHMKIESCSIVGSSFGALVASLAYLLRPDLVRSLVLVGSGSVFHPSEQQKRTLLAAESNGVQAMNNADFADCADRLAAIVQKRECLPAAFIWIQLTSYAKSDRIVAYRNTIRSAVTHADNPESRVFDRLEDLCCPTLIIVGKNDVRADWQWHELGAARISDSTLAIYDECGHLPFLEHPARFNLDIARFLQSLTARQSATQSVDLQ